VTPPRPVAQYLPAGNERVFGVLHEPDAAAARAGAVLLLAPFGWEESASYRTRRLWAADLAHRGLWVLRIDLPGTGDSTGVPGDPGLLAAWIAAVGAAGTWLQDRSRAQRLAVVGLALGGLLAMEAIGAGLAVDDLVLWAVPRRGRTLVREMRAFARLQKGTVPASGEDGGSLEVGATCSLRRPSPDSRRST